MGKVLELNLTVAPHTAGVCAVGTSRFTLVDLMAAYTTNQVDQALAIAEAMLANNDGTYNEAVDAKIQLILAWALTAHGWYQQAQIRLEQAAKHAIGDHPMLRTIILAQYAETMLKFMRNDPEAYASVCRYMGGNERFDASVGIMMLLDREINAQGNPKNLRDTYNETATHLARLRARAIAA